MARRGHDSWAGLLGHHRVHLSIALLWGAFYIAFRLTGICFADAFASIACGRSAGPQGRSPRSLRNAAPRMRRD